MSGFAIETWDDGRLRVNAAFAPVLRANELTTFDAIRRLPLRQVVRRVKARTTSRLVLPDGGRERAFYIKRHDGHPLREVIKPLVRLTRPVLGARSEWDAMIRFHHLGIRTMVPVALGESGRQSFVITEALEGYERLDVWLAVRGGSLTRVERRSLVETVAHVAATMHRAGMHHQDLYFCHMLLPAGASPPQLHVIDLGRVRSCRRLARRWIVKDLAQLHYSAGPLTCADRLRLLRSYLGRPLRGSDRRLVRQIERKKRAIARHTARHRL